MAVHRAWTLPHRNPAPVPSALSTTQRHVDAEVDTIALPWPPGNPYASYQCKGWRQTGGCDPDGVREPLNDKGCTAAISGGLSGYCEFHDPVKNDTIHFMKMSCESLRAHVAFSCNMTFDTVMFHRHAAVYRHPWNLQGDPRSRGYLNSSAFDPTPHSVATRPPGQTWYADAVGDSPSRGIVVVVYEKALVPMYATLRYLRHDLNCTLPIEMWYRSDELSPHNNTVMASMLALPAVYLREIRDPIATGFYVKPYVIFFSQFEQLLFLDADNVPLKDPSFLFNTPEFQATGAVFWPDFWHPQNTIFNVHAKSFVWTLLDLPFIDMFEQESGQLVVDRSRCERALHKLMFYALHRIEPQPPIKYPILQHGPTLPVDPNIIAALVLLWGDKDLFRLAWLSTNTSFHMVSTPPGAIGMYGKPPKVNDRGEFVPGDNDALPDRFCGKAMVQYDVGNSTNQTPPEPLFVHRNTVKLGQSNASRAKQWFAYQRIRPTVVAYKDVVDQYKIKAWRERTSCFGEPLGATETFELTDTVSTVFEAAEGKLLMYADEAAAMLPPETTAPSTIKMSTNLPTPARSQPIKSRAAEPDLID
ncbi:hypothetical protein DYB38_007554 [Aphanomyces astaci]|uniref:Uncharacterized protein n=2 Tax=Aphanomyces astaci TaxID=112090 RepID=A0A397E9S8_APHAT|nr:hypothetical protein DYB38_007554 [Aphanomyces astaci]